MAKAAPFSMRLSDTTDRLVTEEARRTRRTKGAVVEALAEEALRTRRFPGIAFRGSDWNRRPWVIGTALDVWEIVAASRSYGTPSEMAAATDLTVGLEPTTPPYHGRFAGSRAFTDAHGRARNPCKQPQYGVYGRGGRKTVEVKLVDGKWTEATFHACRGLPALTWVRRHGR
jgi:hypothetical protein